MSDVFQTDSDGFYHPSNEIDIKNIILYAKKEGKKIRVRGSAHSVNGAIYTNDDNGIDIMLDKMAAINIDKSNMKVTAQAGCHLGRDPYDPSGTSNLINSLFYQLDQEGLAVNDMGGIIHQTVGGFISTGSAGGSIKYGFSDHIIGIKLIDGNGDTHELTRESGDDLFFAAGVSLGLLGIITEVTFSLVNKFHVKGSESTQTIADCEIALFDNNPKGKPSLQDYFINTEYSRLMWWPQNGFERMVVWKAHQIPVDLGFKPIPYLEFPLVWGTEIPAEAAGGLYYSVAGNWKRLEGLQIPFYVKWVMKLAGALYPKFILPKLLNLFVPLDKDKEPKGAQQFQDNWYKCLPMDNRVNDILMPVEFTEIWIPLEKSAQVMSSLRKYFEQTGYPASGSFSTEIYAAKKSDFWLSPSYNQDVIRVDIFWFKYNEGNPATDFYPQFWNLLMQNKDLSCRYHWGKYMPVNPNYVKSQYPKMNDFLNLRSKLDPSGIFLNKYWKDRLGI